MTQTRTESAVTATERHLADILVPVPYREYRHVGGREWAPADTLTEDEINACEGTDALKLADDIAADVIFRLFEGMGCEVVLGPELLVTLDLGRCPHALPRVTEALQALADLFDSPVPFLTDRVPDTVNRGGKYYYDPAFVSGTFVVPAVIRAVLERPWTA